MLSAESPPPGPGRPSPGRAGGGDSALSTQHSALLPISVVCDRIRSLFNVGSIFRIADAVGIERLYLCGITGHPGYPGDRRPPWVAERASREIAKTAIRAFDAVAWEYRPDAAEVVRELKGRGAQVVALERTAGSVDYTRAAYRFPLCLVLGHEREGVDDAILGQVDLAVEIPMRGAGTSLNVAVAFGIAVYEIARQYRTLVGGGG